MRARFAQLALVHDQDQVCPLNGGQPVRDDYRGTASDHLLQRGTNAKLCFRIDGRCGFIQNQDRRPVCQRARKADQLLLASGECGSALVHLGIEALRQRTDKVTDIDLVRGPLHLCIRDVCRTQANVAADCAGE